LSDFFHANDIACHGVSGNTGLMQMSDRKALIVISCVGALVIALKIIGVMAK
jgi:hypothetical protein